MVQLTGSSSRPAVVLLDVYDTLLRMDDVQKRVNHLLGSKFGYSLWLELFMQYCFVDNCIVQFNDFSAIGRATMQMAAGVTKTRVTNDQIHQVLELLKQLPVHEGVQEGLSSLSDKGFRIAALTNSPEAIVRERMERTGLISYFEIVLSAEHAGKYKPSQLVYEWALRKLDVAPEKVVLVSTHGWDIAGAQNAGMQTAYLKHTKQMLYPLAPQPQFICKDLPDLARQLTAIKQAI